MCIGAEEDQFYDSRPFFIVIFLAKELNKIKNKVLSSMSTFITMYNFHYLVAQQLYSFFFAETFLLECIQKKKCIRKCVLCAQ